MYTIIANSARKVNANRPTNAPKIKKVKDAKSIRILAKENLRRLKKKKCRVRNQETRANVGLETDKHLSVTDSITQEMQVE